MNDNNGTSNKFSEFALHKNIFVKMANYEQLDDLEQGEDGNGGGDYEILTSDPADDDGYSNSLFSSNDDSLRTEQERNRSDYPIFRYDDDEVSIKQTQQERQSVKRVRPVKKRVIIRKKKSCCCIATMATFTTIFAVGTVFSFLVALNVIDFIPPDYPYFDF